MSLDESGIMYAGTQTSDDDKRLFVVFSLESRLDKKATQEANDGMNKYRDVEFITIRIPGDKTTAIHRPVAPSDKQRFPLQYAAFRNARGDSVVGTPLSIWPGISPSRVKELEYFNVRTVEQLAAMPDGVGGSQMMGIQGLKQQARTFVEARKQEAPLLKVQEELAQRDNQIAVLTELTRKQGETLDRLLANLPSHEEKASKKGK